MTEKGKLYLFPVLLGNTKPELVLPEHNLKMIRELKYFIAEDARSARRFLKACGYPEISAAEINLLNEHTKLNSFRTLLEPAFQGNSVGLMSDAGCPGIADPGAEVVREAHQCGIEVVPLVGPSSIVLTIMASGFNGQNFAFNGYLPVDKTMRQKELRELEARAYKYKQAQYFIETPYRNEALFQEMLQVLKPATRICLGIELTLSGQKLMTKTVEEWRKQNGLHLHKVPVVFGIYF